MDHFPGSLFGPPTLVDLLRHRAFHQGDQRAFTYLVDGETEELTLTYAELDRRARSVAAWLQSMNLQGQRALLLYPPGMDFVISFFGCLYAGVIAVPAYPPRMNRSLLRIQSIAADAEVQVALTTEAVLERVQPLLDQTPDLKKAFTWLATDRLPEGLETDWQEPAIRGDTLAFLQYTSGSTGTPKGVVLSHSNLLHNCALISQAFEHTRSSYGLLWLPSYHDMGLVGGILQPIYGARPNILMSPMAFLQRPFRWLQAITKYRATTSGGPNFAYDLCVRKITPEQRAKLDLSSWTVAFNGAEPVRADTIERFTKMFEPCGFRREAFYPCYGLAEATLLVTGGFKDESPIVRAFETKGLENGTVHRVAEDAAGARRLVSSGRMLPDQKVVIVDPEAKTPCAPGQVGEIWVKGPSIAQGYWRRRDETEHTFKAQLADTGEGPFLRTGDLGFFDETELYIAGRLKDLIIIRGLNHYPHDIELTVERSHPAIRPNSGAAFTVEMDDTQRLVIVYEIERRQYADLETVFESIRRDVAREHELLIDGIVLVKAGSIPKTSSGKIQRHACRNEYMDGSLEVIAEWNVAESDASHAPANNEAESAGTLTDRLDAADAIAEPMGTGTVDAASLQGSDREESPLTGSRLSAELLRNGNGAAARSAKRRSIADEVVDEVRRVAKERASGLTLDSSIVELGLDSLERMEILATLEERFGGRFPEEVLPQLESCRDLIAAVEKYLGGGRPASTPTIEVPPENYRFELYPEYVKLKQSMEMLESSGLGNPYFNVHERVTNDTTMIGGKEFINFSSYNYVGMSGDPRVNQAAKDAVDQYGTSVSASRLVSGEKVVHRELESAISDFIGSEDAIVFVGGHSTNETTVGHLFGPGDLILHDALAHNSIIQGCILSGARRRPFPHNDWRAVDRLLGEMRGEYRRVLIAIEGVYSMDGDIPELPRFIEVKHRHKAFLMVDEAHSIGTLGAHGRGIGEHYDVNPSDVDLWMGTLSKSFGSCGGYIAGTKSVVEYLKYTAPGFVYSVGISPSNAAAALAAIRLLEAEPERVARVHDRAKLFLTLAKKQRLNTGMSKDSPVVPVILGNSLHCLQLSRALSKHGINVQPILYPAVEERAARLRFFITSSHTEDQIRYTVDAVAEELRKISPKYTANLPLPATVGASMEPSTRM